MAGSPGRRAPWPRRCTETLLLLVVWGLLVPAPAIAAEIDSVTPRAIALADSTQAINGIFNRRLAQGVANANPGEDDLADMDSRAFCDEDRLYAELRKAIFGAFLPRWGLRGYELDLQLRELLAESSHSLALEDSIYRDIGYLEGFSLRLKELSAVVRIHGHWVGLDKIGHFFAEGWAYFERTREDAGTLQAAMDWGSRQEAGRFGYATTGVHSFADLTANLNGWRFWNDVLHRRHDPLKGIIANLFSTPYVHCEYRIIDSLRHRKIVKAWRLDRHFDVSDYVDGAWDEGNNCNSYAEPGIEEKVNARIREASPGFHCPAEPGECVRAQEKYGPLAEYVLHPRCLAANE